MENYEPRPMAVFLKLHAIYNAVCNGNATLADIAEATGFPATTVLRIAPLLVEDDRVDTKLVDGQLCLTMRIRFNPDAFN